MKIVKENIDSGNSNEVKALARKAKLTLLKNQKYSLRERDSLGSFDLKVEKEASLELIGFEGGDQQISFLRSQRKGNSHSLSHSSVKMR